jgi:hypothetical protein
MLSNLISFELIMSINLSSFTHLATRIALAHTLLARVQEVLGIALLLSRSGKLAILIRFEQTKSIWKERRESVVKSRVSFFLFLAFEAQMDFLFTFVSSQRANRRIRNS